MSYQDPNFDKESYWSRRHQAVTLMPGIGKVSGGKRGQGDSETQPTVHNSQLTGRALKRAQWMAYRRAERKAARRGA